MFMKVSFYILNLFCPYSMDIFLRLSVLNGRKERKKEGSV